MATTTDNWRSEINERLTHIEQKISLLETQNAVDEVHHKNVEKRLTSIEGTLQWLVRLIIGSILLAAMTFIMGGGIG